MSLSTAAFVELSHRRPACTRNFTAHFSLLIWFVEDMDCSYQAIHLVPQTKLLKAKMFAKYVFRSNENEIVFLEQVG